MTDFNNRNAGEEIRGWEYARAGDYHRNLDLNWSYAPTYLRKMHFVRLWLDALGHEARVLDAGCGEGVLVEEYSAKGWNVAGIDLHYSSQWVRQGDILSMPYNAKSFDAVLLLDVFEHIAFVDQLRVLQEIKRVLKPGGNFLASIPNLAHLNSRVWFMTRGRLDRTDTETNHIRERPFSENLALLRASGFDVVKTRGITLTLPWVYRNLICRSAARYRWLHDLLEPFAIPSIAMLDLFYCRVATDE